MDGGARSVWCDNLSFANAIDRPIEVQGAAGTVTLTNVYGTSPAATTGVRALQASHVVVPDADTGTTVGAGAGVDVTVGVLGTKSWADIAGGAYADTNDNAGALAGGTGVTVTPA